MSVEELKARLDQLNLDMIAWHDCDDAEYAAYFKSEGDRLLEAIAQEDV